jgi:hypothetical protein
MSSHPALVVTRESQVYRDEACMLFSVVCRLGTLLITSGAG